MSGVISATNEAILRAKTEQDLYQLVCDAAVESGKSAATVAAGATGFDPVETGRRDGAIVDQITRAPFSIDPENVYGAGVCGRAFRTKRFAADTSIPIDLGKETLASDRARDGRQRLRRGSAGPGR